MRRVLESAFAPGLRVLRPSGSSAVAAATSRSDSHNLGVTGRPLPVIPGEPLAIIGLALDGPGEQPLHCPAARPVGGQRFLLA